MWLLILAIIGNIVPGGLFLYWLAHDYTSFAAALLGTLAFAIPLFVWLNWRLAGEPHPSFRDWWKVA